MIISQKFQHFTAEWDKDNPDNVLIDAYDVSYNTDVEKLIQFVSEIQLQKQRIKMMKAL